MDVRKYVRVYYDLAREYPSVFADDALLATWLRLLMVAEAMWPDTPEIPRSARRGAVAHLLDCGLLVAVPPYGYRVRGLDAERNRRRNAARNAAGIRWGIADGHAISMPSTSTSTSTNPPLPPQGGRSRKERREQSAPLALARLLEDPRTRA